jgi:hypothetical protein
MTPINFTVNNKSWVPHTSILMCGHRAKLDRFPVLTPNTVISTEAMDSFIVHRAAERPPYFAFVFAVALGPRYPKASALGLSGPATKSGFSPWGMPSSPSHNRLNEAAA